MSKSLQKVSAFSRLHLTRKRRKGKSCTYHSKCQILTIVHLSGYFCSKTQAKIDCVHKEAMRILFEDYTSSFDEHLINIRHSITFRGRILWSSLTDSIQCSQTTMEVNRQIEKWKGEKWTCKTFL